MNRPLFVGAIGALIVGAAIASTAYFEFYPGARPQGGAPASAPDDGARSGPPTPIPEAATDTAKAESKAALAAPEIAKEPVRPSFDVVRVNPEGDAVMAGRAAPNAEVTVSDGGKEIGKVKADSRGEWVLVPSKSLPAGPHELSLESEAKPKGKDTKDEKDQPKVLSDRKVILVVPERGKDIAGRKTDAPSGPLVMVVPRDDSGAPTVLQKPEESLGGKPGETATAKATTEAATTETTTAATATDEAAKALSKLAPAAGGPADAKAGDVDTGHLRDIPRRPGAPVQTAARDAGRGAADPALSVDAIDYDEQGNISMSGRAPEGARVRVYLDNRPIGDATAGEGADKAKTAKSTKVARAGDAGVWRLQPSVTVPPGLYRMRVDQIDRSGQVVARVETPFSRAGPMGDLPQGAVIFVQPGNSLWRIARRSYGAGLRYTVIYEANREQIRDPDLIYPGQIFVVPKVN